jgi:ketosteroid isomerase-like protein
MLRRGTKRASAVLATSLLAAASFCSLAQTPTQRHAPREQHMREHKHEAREEVQGLEKRFQQAQLSDDVPTMDKLLSDDYLGINVNGELSTKNQQLDHMRTRKLVLNGIKMSDQKIKVVGQIAIVTSVAQIDGMLDDQPLRGNFRYTRVYQQLPDGSWKVTSFEATRIKGGSSADNGAVTTTVATSAKPS